MPNYSGNFKRGFEGGSVGLTRTHRFLFIDPATDDASVLVPPHAELVAILDPENAIAYEIHSAARGGVEALASRRELDAADEAPAREVTPGEFINISHQDGSTAIGEVTLCFFGGLDLDTSEATVSDPGA